MRQAPLPASQPGAKEERVETGGQSGHDWTLVLRCHPARIVTVGRKAVTQGVSGLGDSALG